MRPRDRWVASEQYLFRSWLDQIIDMKQTLVKLSLAIGWRALVESEGIEFTDENGGGPGIRLRKRHPKKGKPPVSQFLIELASA